MANGNYTATWPTCDCHVTGCPSGSQLIVSTAAVFASLAVIDLIHDKLSNVVPVLQFEAAPIKKLSSILVPIANMCRNANFI